MSFIRFLFSRYTIYSRPSLLRSLLLLYSSTMYFLFFCVVLLLLLMLLLLLLYHFHQRCRPPPSCTLMDCRFNSRHVGIFSLLFVILSLFLYMSVFFIFYSFLKFSFYTYRFFLFNYILSSTSSYSSGYPHSRVRNRASAGRKSFRFYIPPSFAHLHGLLRRCIFRVDFKIKYTYGRAIVLAALYGNKEEKSFLNDSVL